VFLIMVQTVNLEVHCNTHGRDYPWWSDNFDWFHCPDLWDTDLVRDRPLELDWPTADICS
jgi:hypothetical protein